MAKRRIISLVAVASVILSGCAQQQATTSAAAPGTSAATQSQAASGVTATSRANADGTTTDGDGFVRFPGEPTRNDPDHYYVIEDVCGQFTRPFMEGLTGRTFKKLEPAPASTTYACYYYTATKATDGHDDYILLVLDYLNVARQKTGQQALGRTVAANPTIPMDNFVATQENGAINAVYFVFGTDKFLRLDRSSTSALADTDMLGLAVKLGTKMKEFK